MQTYLIETFWSEEDEAYLCIAPDLPGCSAAGNTPLEAIQEMQDAIVLAASLCQHGAGAAIAFS
ncbi:MAG: type II toxin-antitoxin system HicB family antitoxin [Methylovulum sp.]|uniref:type II toxin-antitoxin system HicB family antitoxin n=1 Tax=Methylovulum sp. TaxID=1916980 RepID=UPI00262B3445|nr:type II toxin-antitoxin system HicB family antitoxin [Methylovulum sp.]MDD2724896.1 type II toxin-antitoxin system HicB family antitoxin [Methylovulum sp.]MDD5124702.1 type II toxin-antitoxin system HicB family antitoxin [Methylovulum sp.]